LVLSGGLLGSVVGFTGFTANYISPLGTIFINLLKLITVPLVLASLKRYGQAIAYGRQNRGYLYPHHHFSYQGKSDNFVSAY